MENVEKFRLPTEAEWEYACRAGSTSVYFFGDNEEELKKYAWYRKNTVEAGEGYLHEVAKKAPNPWGLYDMYGNVFEYCEDLYSFHYDHNGRTPVVDPRGPSDSIRYHWDEVLRGGCFLSDAWQCRSAKRSRTFKNFAHAYSGFRLARDE